MVSYLLGSPKDGNILRESMGNLSVALIIISAPSSYFLVIKPFKNGTIGFFSSHLIGELEILGFVPLL